MNYLKYNITKKRLNEKFNLFEVLTHFQTAAFEHATLLGFGFEPMLQKDMFWVLLRTKFIIEKDIPSQDINIETYPKIGTRAYNDREYILSLNNDVLVKGISRWTIINSSTRRLIRTALEFPGEFISKSNFDSIDKIVYDDNKLELISNYKVTEIDLDELKHMNNVNYARIIESVYDTSNINEFQIDYLNEAILNDQIDVYMYKDDYIYILGKIKDKNCFIAKIKEN